MARKTLDTPAKKGRTWGIELDVVGMQFRWTKSAREMLAGKSIKSELEREPENEYDANAVKVNIHPAHKGLSEIAGKQLGYLRRESAELLAPRLDAGTLEFVSATVTEVDAQSGNAKVTIRFRDKAARKGK